MSSLAEYVESKSSSSTIHSHTLLSLLPKPKNVSKPSLEQQLKQQQQQKLEQQKKQEQQKQNQIPPYGQRYSKWIPKNESDFGDGGAYPEIHVAQFPLGMGRKDKVATETSQQTLALVIDPGNGQNAVLQTSAQIARQGQRKDKIVYSQYTDLIEHQIDDEGDALMKPSEVDIERNAAETREALEKIINSKISGTHQNSQLSKLQQNENEPEYFRYTSATAKPGQESRIIKVNEAAIDPMEPARFHMKKIATRPPSPPPPVLHSPDKKLTKEEREEWNIAPATSNWKNPKGYTIPLHQRLAADGRELQEVHINNNFAKFSEAMYIAEHEIRKDIDDRAELQRRVLIKQKEAREEKLRLIAQRARHARYGGNAYDENAGESPAERPSEVSGGAGSVRNNRDSDYSSSDAESDKEVNPAEMKRNRLREERAREYRYDRRRNKSRPNVRDEEREISEKIALGQATSGGGYDDEIDSRLSTYSSGLDSGFGADDTYNLYDKPLSRGSSANQIYRPSREAIESYGGGMNDLETDLEGEGGRFTGKGFKGRDGDAPSHRSSSGPVQFERDEQYSRDDRRREPEAPRRQSSSSSNSSNNRDSDNRQEQNEQQDPFGWGKFMTDAQPGKKRALDHIGKSGQMKASSGSSSTDAEHYRSSKRKRIDFQSSGHTK
jgi:SNW domain-containing protein 1